jgi:hypothetical protein
MSRNPIVDALTTVEREGLRAIKDAMQKAPLSIAPYVIRNFSKMAAKPSSSRGAKGLRKAKSGNLYWNEPNNTNKLRRLYGNLTRAVTPGERGNVTKTEIKDGAVVTTFSFDSSTTVKAGTETTTLLYGEKWEKGSRPFLGPGTKAYMREEFPRLIKALQTELVDIYNGGGNA